MPYPEKLGQPCWVSSQVPKVVSLTAQTSAASAPYFLAAHSPFKRITDAKSAGRTLTEEEVFKSIFSKARGQVQVFVRGEPGTGKSHLIRWLKERSSYAARQQADGLDNFHLVIVTRGNGSLKDALGQIVQQLGSEFERHLARVQGAIDRLSDQTARATLLSELALELGSRWSNEHGRAPLAPRLRHLGDALNAPGLGRWLKRDGGVIHKLIQRLTEQSSSEDRENFPSFDSKELDIPLTYLTSAQNPGEVIQLAEDLMEEPESKELAVAALNTALSDAVRALTGLKGDDLVKIFTDIRRQLGPNKSLGIFIEDVSVTGLDQDVVNAFEPRDAEGLCRMVAILGITENGWQRLPDNQRQRATHIYEVGGRTVAQWASDAQEVAKFTARYLNAVRSSDEEISAAAEERFEGDFGESHCNKCPAKEECHQVFGKIDIGGGVEVGMFPYSPSAPQAMLQNLSDARYKSQRGLLDQVLLPVLDHSLQLLANKEFPRPQLFAVISPSLTFWSGFENRYCSGVRWSDAHRARLKFLAQFWVASNSAEESAATLKQFLKPLGLPDFPASVVAPTLRGAVVDNRVGQPPPPTRPTPQPQPHDRELERLLGLLENWKSGQPLNEDNKFRALLGPFISRSILWQDIRSVPIAEKKRHMSATGTTYRFPKIEGQVMNPGGNFFIDFTRSSDTYKLLHSLLLFSHSPDGTWNFEHGELQKREMSRWLRKHQIKVLASLQPDPSSIPQKCLRSAVQVLALTALLRDRRKLPENRVERLSALFSGVWQPADKPAVVSPEFEAILSDLELKQAPLREYVVQEIGSGQGDADPKDFIDPMPVLTTLEEFDAKVKFEPPPIEAEANFWKSRFQPISTLRAGIFATIEARIERERSAVGAAVIAIRDFIKDAGFDPSDASKSLEPCLAELNMVIGLQRGGQHQRPALELPHEEFDNLWKKKQLQTAEIRSSWSASIRRGAEIAQVGDSNALLVFNSAKLKECISAIKTVKNHLELIDQHMSDQEGGTAPGGDSRPQLLIALEAIAALAPAKEKENQAEA